MSNRVILCSLLLLAILGVNDAAGQALIDDGGYYPAVSRIGVDKIIIVWDDGDNIEARIVDKDQNIVRDTFQVSSFDSDMYSDSPAVTAIGNDKFIVVWEVRDVTDLQWDIYAKIFSIDGSVLVDQFRVNSYTTDDQQVAAVTPLGIDRVFISWDSFEQDGDNGDWGVWGTIISITGETILPEFRVNDKYRKGQEYSAVTTVGNDKILVAWEAPDGGGKENGIYFKLLNLTGHEILPETRANTKREHDQTTVAVAAIDDDKFIITWEDDGERDGDDDAIFATVYNIDGSLEMAQFQVNTATNDDQNAVQVAYLGDGKVFFVWQSDQNDENYEVFGRIINTNGDPNNAPEFRLSANAEENQEEVVVAVLTPDLVFAAWTDYQGSQVYGRFISITNDLPVYPTAAFRVNQIIRGEQDRPKVAALDNGLIFAAWESYGEDGDEWDVFAAIMTHDGTIVVPQFQVNDQTLGSQDTVSVASLGGKKVVVAWEARGPTQEDEKKNGVYVKIFDSAGAWETTEFLVNDRIRGEQENPVVAALSDTTFVVVYEARTEDGDKDGVFAKILDDQLEEVVGQFQVNNYTMGNQDRPAVAVVGDKILFAWQSAEYGDSERRAGRSMGVFAKLMSSTGEDILPEWQVNTYSPRNQKVPQVAAIGDDKFVIAWESVGQDGDEEGIFATVMDVTGEVILPEFQANTFTEDEQEQVAVAAIDDNRILIAWESEGDQDGDDDGVFARIFYLSGETSLPEFRISDKVDDDQEEIDIISVGNNAVFAIWEGDRNDNNDSDEIFARLLVFATPPSAPPCPEFESDVCHVRAMCTSMQNAYAVPSGGGVTIVPPQSAIPAESDGKFLCECYPEQVGHGYGPNGCETGAYTVRVLFKSRSGLLRWEVDDLLVLMGGLTCTAGSLNSCDHIYYQWHGYDLAVNVLFRGTAAGKAGADLAASNFNAAAPAAARRDTVSYPPAVDPSVGARVYQWTAGTTGDGTRIPPSGMELLSVSFEPACAKTGCWVLDLAYTTGSSDTKLETFNSFFLPYAVGSDTLSYDYDYDFSGILDTFQPANFPCQTFDYTSADGTTASLPLSVSGCCLGEAFNASETGLGGSDAGLGMLGNYRVTTEFSAYAAAAYTDLCPDITVQFGGINKSATLKPEDVFPDGEWPTASSAPGPSFHAKDFLTGGFVDMPDSPGVTETRIVDGFIGMFQATIKLDEVELRTKAGLLKGTVGVEHTIDTFIGYANFRPATTSYVLDTMATQAAIHLEKTSFFSVSTHGVNDYTFLEYVNMRLVTVYKQDRDFSDAGNGGSTLDFIETNSSGSADYVQVTFTLGPKYEVNSNSELIPTDSVRAGKGTFLGDAAMEHKCQLYEEAYEEPPASDFPAETFCARLKQPCAPGCKFCASPSAIPDQFVSYNIPLGIDFFPSPEQDLSANIFVHMVVSAIVKPEFRQGAMGLQPNEGGDPFQMKTTLSASIPVVAGGINIFCDGLVSKTDLRDVADVDIVVGSAVNATELSRLRIMKDIASTQLDPTAITQIDSDSIEAGLMTMVLKGNASYFGVGNSRLASVSLELEDVISIHIMESDGTGADASVVDDVMALITAAPDDNSEAAGLLTDGYFLNDAFYFKVEREFQRASLEPSPALLAICPFNPTRPTQAELETCVTRRDVRHRGYPARAGSFSTAMEICANVVETQGVNSGCEGGACCTTDTASSEAKFMATILGDNDYAKQLAVDYAAAIADAYDLNQRYRRAFWINPGYEWTPTQTGGASLFQVSQKIFLFALISLDEGLEVAAGPVVSGDAGDNTPSFRRRMLLQSGPADQMLDAQASAGGGALAFETTTTTMMAKAFDVPVDRVATFSARLALTNAEACSDDMRGLQISLRAQLEDNVQGYISEYETLQVTRLAIDKAGLECRRRTARAVGGRGLLAAHSGASAQVTMLVVFSKGTASMINMQQIALKPGMMELTPLELSPKISVVDGDQIVNTPEPDSDSTNDNTAIIAGVCGGAGGLALVAGAALLWSRSRREEVSAVAVSDEIDLSGLKAALADEL